MRLSVHLAKALAVPGDRGAHLLQQQIGCADAPERAETPLTQHYQCRECESRPSLGGGLPVQSSCPLHTRS